MKVLVIGANGQLGSDICEVFAQKHEIAPATHEDGDITDKQAMERLFADATPGCVINTAAMHNVEACEKDPGAAYRVNALGAKNLAELCAEQDIPFIHISTDYVFDGKKGAPYSEDDVPHPLNVYGNTKLSGENYALAACDKAAIVRVSGIYGKNPCRAKGGLNFVQLMLKLAKERPQIRVVDDETVTPTPTLEIAKQLQIIVENGLTGIIHTACQGQCSWYEFARAIFAISGVKTDLQKARPGEFPAKVKRPMYSVLQNSRLKSLNMDKLPNWKEALQSYVIDQGQ